MDAIDCKLEHSKIMSTPRPQRCPCDQIHGFTPDQCRAFDTALASYEMNTIQSLDLPNDKKIALISAFQTHGWPFAWRCGPCLLTRELTAVRSGWHTSDKSLLLVLRDEIELSWEVIAGRFMFGTLAEECKGEYDTLKAALATCTAQ